LTSGGLGTMGFGMPAALGAQAAFRDKLVLCIAGDGSFQMNMQEMATAVVNKLPVKVFILNNHFHGMVRQWQDLFYEGRYASSYLDTVPDFVKLAEAFNAVGLRATKVGEVDGVIKEAVKVDQPVVENKFGVLSRVANLFSGRGYNIETLSVAPTLDPSMSMMTIVTRGDDKIIEQIVKQLNKVIDVIKVVDLNESEFVERETALIKTH